MEAVSDPQRWEGFKISPHLTVERLVRVTSTSIAYRAHSTRHQASVFVKVFFRSLGSREHRAARYYEEGIVLAHLNHPNAPSFLEAGISEGHPYLVTSFVDGIDLHAFAMSLNEQEMPAPDRRDILRGIVIRLAKLISEVHQAGVIHRDLKPGNVIVCRDGHVHLVDWGIAYAPNLAPGSPVSRARTVAYASPERLLGGRGDAPPEDAFALGVIAAQLLLGLPPTQVRTMPERMVMWRLSREGWDRELSSGVARLLSKVPQKRVHGLVEVEAL